MNIRSNSEEASGPAGPSDLQPPAGRPAPSVAYWRDLRLRRRFGDDDTDPA